MGIAAMDFPSWELIRFMIDTNFKYQIPASPVVSIVFFRRALLVVPVPLDLPADSPDDLDLPGHGGWSGRRGGGGASSSSRGSPGRETDRLEDRFKLGEHHLELLGCWRASAGTSTSSSRRARRSS